MASASPQSRPPQSSQYFKTQLLGRIGFCVITLLGWTLRIRVKDEAGLLDKGTQRQAIWMLWHNRILIVPFFHNRFTPWITGAVLTSPSKDGAILEAVIRCFGLGAVRGSSSRGGSAALLELIEMLRNGESIAITPDGPRGPKYDLKPGVVQLSVKTGMPILPINVSFSGYWRLKSWDGFIIPKPFSKVTIHLKPLINLQQPADEKLSPETIAALCSNLREKLMDELDPA